MSKEYTSEERDPQILFATTNVGRLPDAWQTAFHHPRILGQTVADAGFDGVALQPQYMMRQVDMVARAVEVGDLRVESLLQSPLHFNAERGRLRPHLSSQWARVGARVIQQTWSESLEYFRLLQDKIGQRPAVIYSQADRAIDETTQVLAHASSYAVQFDDALAKTWQAQNRASLLTEANLRGFTVCLNTHSSYRSLADVLPVVSTALDNDARLPAIAAATTDVHVGLMKRRAANREPDPASLEEVVNILQKGQLPPRVKRIARAVITWGAPQRVVLQLGAKDLARALTEAGMCGTKIEPGEMQDVWGGYKLIGQALRKEFSF